MRSALDQALDRASCRKTVRVHLANYTMLGTSPSGDIRQIIGVSCLESNRFTSRRFVSHALCLCSQVHALHLLNPSPLVHMWGGELATPYAL